MQGTTDQAFQGGPTGAPAGWPEVIGALTSGVDLTRAQAGWAMDRILGGDVTPAQLAGFLVGLRAKGETVDEVVGLLDVMMQRGHRFTVPGPAVDIVGTGGDLARTVNISTTAAVVVAGTGVRVIKHGNRAASSASGSADVLEALGIRLDHAPERVRAIALEAGITFCFAQVFHPSMRHAAPTRRELGVPTVFNILGPLANPAQPAAMAVGVALRELAPVVAGVLAARGTRALVFRTTDGLDELAATAPAEIWEVRDGEVVHHHLDLAAELGLRRIAQADLRGGTAEQNAEALRGVVDGVPGPVRETVLLNAAAALVADASLPGTDEGTLAARLRAGYAHAERSVDGGDARQALERWVLASRDGAA